MKQGDVAIETMRVLDAGCGTGNYSRALLPFIGTVIGIDKNEVMLKIAADNCASIGNAQFVQASIVNLPFPPESFDAVLITQVLHHLADYKTDFTKHQQVIREIRRVLKKKGKIIIAASSQEQLTNSVWYFSLLPKQVIERFRGRHIPHPDLIRLLFDEGFIYQGKFVPVDLPLQGEAYFDSSAILDENWRKSNSIWSEIPIEDLTRIIDLWTAMSQEQRDFYMIEKDRIRLNIGQTSFLYAVLDK